MTLDHKTQSQILDLYTAGHLDLSAIADICCISFDDLVAFLDAPATTARLDTIERLANRRAALIAAEARVVALTRLQAIAACQPEPGHTPPKLFTRQLETTRKAAAQLLRLTTPRVPRPSSAVPIVQAQPPNPPPTTPQTPITPTEDLHTLRARRFPLNDTTQNLRASAPPPPLRVLPRSHDLTTSRPHDLTISRSHDLTISRPHKKKNPAPRHAPECRVSWGSVRPEQQNAVRWTASTTPRRIWFRVGFKLNAKSRSARPRRRFQPQPSHH